MNDLRTLLPRIEAGDIGAWGDLAESLRSMVVRHADRILRNAEDAENAAQEALTKLYSVQWSQYTFASIGDLIAFVKKMVYHECMRILRERRRRQAVSLNADPGDPIDPADSGELAPLAEAVRGELGQAVRESVEALPEHLGVVVELRYFEGLTTEEIGAQLGIGARAVRYRLGEALAMMGQELGRRGLP